MTKQDEIVTEAVARAITQALGMDPDSPLPCSDLKAWQINDHIAIAAITAMRAAERGDDDAELIENTLFAIRGMLAGYAGHPSRAGDAFKVADAALDRLQRKAPETGEG